LDCVETSLLDYAGAQWGDDRLVAGVEAAAPDRTLQKIAAQLEALGGRAPRRGTRWQPSSVKRFPVPPGMIPATQ
jgi:hypothetical protein